MAVTTNGKTALATLQGLGFKDASTIRHRPRLIICTTGKEKTGKTELCLSAPSNLDPVTGREGIAYAGFDRPLEEAQVNKYRKLGKKIYEKYYSMDNTAATQQDWTNLWLQFKADWEVMCSVSRTVILDTGTHAWELIRLARFGRLEKILPVKYGPVNNEFETLVKLPQKHNGLNCIITHRSKKEYKAAKRAANSDSEEKEVWTGGYERAGFGGLPFEAQLCLEHFRDDSQYSVDKFGIRITDSALNAADTLGQTVTGYSCMFPAIAMMCYPDSQWDEWE
ncbi:MAG: hypothetical protein LC131_05430 [Anaerolineae bacterium]|nr:hypothetical protein [Anaerolineae bacterium]